MKQVTFDVAWSPNCTDGRCYDAVGLSRNTDFLVVMAYDERSQIYDSCIASANSAGSTTASGVQSYLDLGIKAEKLVLGLPWYGYNYPCINLTSDVCYIKPVPFRGASCSDAAGMYVCVYVCLYVCVYVCMYVVYVSMYVCMYVCVCEYVCMCVCVCVYVCRCVCMFPSNEARC